MRLELLLAVLVLVVCWQSLEAAAASTKKAKSSKAKAVDENIATFSSKEHLSKHMKDLEKKNKEGMLDESPSEEELIELRKEEIRVRLSEEDIISKHGKNSREYAQYLHKLGRTIYKQERYEELLELSQQIVHIHEQLDGPEHESTARALGNVGSVAFRINRKEECNLAMSRAMHIWVKKFGENSKEVLLHRGKMLTFRLPNAETTLGMSYSDYEDHMEL